MAGEMLIALAALIIATVDRVSLTSNSPPQHLLAHLTYPIALTLLMYDICEDHFKISGMPRLLGLLKCLGDLSILIAELFHIFCSTDHIFVIVTSCILTVF